ncbi:MAG: hypothetical protein AB8G22_05760 [Saprospiraceae bacterium]
MPTTPFIHIKNPERYTIADQLDSYGYAEQNLAETHVIAYEIHQTTDNHLVIEFPNGIPFPEFLFVTMDMCNQKLYKADSVTYGFYDANDHSAITQVFDNQPIALFSDEDITEEDELESMKIVTADHRLYEIELADLYSTPLPEKAIFPIGFARYQKTELIEEGKIFIEKEDYEAEYLEDLKER